MQILQELIRSKKLKQALVYLRCLAQERQEGGGTRFVVWRLSHHEAGASVQLANASKWLEQAAIPPDGLDNPGMWLALMAALDNELEISGHGLPPVLLPIRSPVPDWNSCDTFWVLPRRQPGYLCDTPTYLEHYHPNHSIVPTRLSREMGDVHFTVRQLNLIWPERPRLAIAGFDDEIIPQGSQQGRCVFYESTSDDAARLAAARRLISEAESQGVHILLFPELTLSPANQQAIMDDLYARRSADNAGILLLIGLGSFHEYCPLDSGTIPRNRARLISGRDGRVEIEQDKFQAASAGEGGAAVDEAFRPAEQANALLTPMGLLALAICKDLFDQNTAWIWQTLSPHWLLVPSMSNKLNRHQEATANLWKRHGCVSAVANQPLSPVEQAAWGYVQRADLEVPMATIGRLMVFELPFAANIRIHQNLSVLNSESRKHLSILK